MSDTIRANQCPHCGAPLSAETTHGLCPKCALISVAHGTEPDGLSGLSAEIPSLERVAEAFPQLEILELIGRGGMGFVYKARQPHLDRLVALKILPEQLARDPRFAERFNREGRVLARLNHPNIVSVYDFGQAGCFCYLLMEFVDGVNLKQALEAGRFSPEEALSIVPKICEALQFAHDQGILHRDIKPANILLDARGQAKLADFGIAKLVGTEKPDVTLTMTGTSLGTPHYMAPEQLEKPAEVDHRADIYSLGVVFYEMLTGELPIGRFAAPSFKTPVSKDVDEVVFRTLEKDRERRYQAARQVQEEVEHMTEAGAAIVNEAAWAADAERPPVPPATPDHAAPRIRWVRPLTWALAAGFVACVAVGGWWLRIRATSRADVGTAAPAAVEPMIQFTFTRVQLEEEEGARWLAMDYLQQIRGRCERAFRSDVSVPGFVGQMRASDALTDAKDGFPPMRYQRVAWKLPDSLPLDDAQALRDMVANQRVGKPISVIAGEEFPLFKVLVPGGGAMVSAIAVRLTPDAL